MDSAIIFKVAYTKSVKKYIEKQDSAFKERVNNVISDLSKDPYNNDGELSGHKKLYKKRFGKYRLLFQIHEAILTITLVELDSRGQVYKGI